MEWVCYLIYITIGICKLMKKGKWISIGKDVATLLALLAQMRWLFILIAQGVTMFAYALKDLVGTSYEHTTRSSFK
jgi:hypothetical protein